VSECIANRQVSEGQKEKLCNVYNRFSNQHSLNWVLPNSQRVRTLPFVSKQDDILQLINSLSRRQGTFVQTIMETAARPGEVFQLQWTDIDSENNTITINHPEKGSNPRRLRVSCALIAKLNCMRAQPKSSRVKKTNPKFLKKNDFRLLGDFFTPRRLYII
jgi:integrase